MSLQSRWANVRLGRCTFCECDQSSTTRDSSQVKAGSAPPRSFACTQMPASVTPMMAWLEMFFPLCFSHSNHTGGETHTLQCLLWLPWRNGVIFSCMLRMLHTHKHTADIHPNSNLSPFLCCQLNAYPLDKRYNTWKSIYMRL